jgi:hypothetical protein
MFEVVFFYKNCLRNLNSGCILLDCVSSQKTNNVLQFGHVTCGITVTSGLDKHPLEDNAHGVILGTQISKSN